MLSSREIRQGGAKNRGSTRPSPTYSKPARLGAFWASQHDFEMALSPWGSVGVRYVTNSRPCPAKLSLGVSFGSDRAQLSAVNVARYTITPPFRPNRVFGATGDPSSIAHRAPASFFRAIATY